METPDLRRRVGLLCNPFSGTGRERVLELGRSAYACLATQADLLVGPGDLGANAGDGSAKVVGSDATGGRDDTLATTQAMIAAGADLLVVVSGDGTYNDALAGMKRWAPPCRSSAWPPAVSTRSFRSASTIRLSACAATSA